MPERPVVGQLEQRAALESAAAPTVDGRLLHGVVPYSVTSRDLGGWTEVLEPGCLRAARLDDLVARVDHAGVPIGRHPGTLELEDTDQELRWSVELPESRRDTAEACARGDLQSCSWSMVVGRDEWRGTVRHVHEIAELRDVSVVTTGAYPEARAEYRAAPDPDPAAPTAPEPEPEPEAIVPEASPAGGLAVEDRTAAEQPTVETRVLEEIASVRKGESRALSTSSASAITPPELSTFLWDLLYPQSVLLSAGIQVVTTDRESVVYPRLMSATTLKARRSYGSGSLYLRTDGVGRETWYGHWRTNGRQLKRRIGPKRTEGTRDGLTRRQAEAELRRLIAEVRTTPTVGETLTIDELGRRYLQHLERQGRKKATLTAVESVLRLWLAPHFGQKAIDKIKLEDVTDLMRRMEAGGAGKRQKPVGAKSIRNYLGTLSALFNYAEKRGWATLNPVRRVDLPGVERDEDIRFLDPYDVQVLADRAVEGPYQSIDRALYLTAAMTGLRQGELVALRWRDVDLPAGRIRVRQNYVLGEFGTPKSKRSTRSVPMADAVATELVRLQGATALDGDVDLVFADAHTGGPLSKAAILRRYRRALRAAQLDERHRFHDLRHTFGTRMAAAGVAMRTLQEWMGHRDIETTQRYADYAPSSQEAALVAAAFGSSANEHPLARGDLSGEVTASSQP